MAIHRDKECIVRLIRYEIRNFLVPCLSLAFGEVRCHPPIIAPAIRIHIRTGVSSQVKWAKFRHKVYQCRGEVSPGSIPAEKLVSNGLVVLQSVAGAGHVNNLAAVDEAVEDSGGNGGIAEEVGPLVKALVGSNDQ